MIYKTPYTRSFFIIFILGITFFYSHYEKKKIEKLSLSSRGLILQNLPEIKVKSVLNLNEDIFAKKMIEKESRGLVVHFWGTWCAPCEAELPSFIDLAKKFEEVPVNFLLIAVNDEKKKIMKFLKRFKDMPSNIFLGLDNSGSSMELLGTVKVPETYLFSSKGKHLRKFVGPQEWSRDLYTVSIRDLLSI